MKIIKYLFIIASIGLSFISCTKEKENPYLKQIYNSPTTKFLSEKEFNIVESLFKSNQLDYSNYQFYRYETDNLGSYVRCYQFVNGLEVFLNELIFHFDANGGHRHTSGNTVSSIPLDVNPSMQMEEVAEIFLQQVKNDNGILNRKEILKGNFDLQFGYYDLNIFMSIPEKKFTKAWKITPRNHEYPYCYVDDISGNMIYYNNGIISGCF